jgi:methyl coenzyme M reductase alpha subunit
MAGSLAQVSLEVEAVVGLTPEELGPIEVGSNTAKHVDLKMASVAPSRRARPTNENGCLGID